jgi:hypothetical protein
MRHLALLLGVGGMAIAAGCGTNSAAPADSFGISADAGGDDTGSNGGGSSVPPPNGGIGGGIGSLVGDASLDGAPTLTVEPQTCDQAANAHSYVGCDYWPTIVANVVWSVFDFAVVIANAGQSVANVTVTGPSNTNQTAMVPPGQLVKMYLPWVQSLKGPDSDNCGGAPAASSVMQAAGAFHLVSSVPVTVYQFNALEYQPRGGPPGKNWNSCPGLTTCMNPASPNYLGSLGCLSFSNDASLLLPTTAMTGNYRVAGHTGVILRDPTSGQMFPLGAYMAVTGTLNGTTVIVKVSGAGLIAAGTGVTATNSAGTLRFTLNAGDVAQLVGANGTDLSGSIVQASAPVQVITGHPCYQIPPTAPTCDHMEESVFPAETWGKDYVVTRPAGPNGASVPHQVRFYGNFDNTHLTYNPATPPPGCPSTLAAGQVVECGVGGACPTTVDPTQTYNCGTIDQDFEVTGDQPFAVGMFTLGSSIVDPNKALGDPAQTFATAVEQYRSNYVFLAPDDYTANYVDIVAKPGTNIVLDGQNLAATPQGVASGTYDVYRVKLGTGQAGAHVLSATQRVGIQVVGYGTATSYMYPGGLDLARIAPPPGPIQ